MTRITNQDLKHMKEFPTEKRAQVMQQIMSKLPLREFNFEGTNTYGRAIQKLRTDGLGLIDLQPQETAVTTIWYMKNTSYLGFLKSEVAALVFSEFKPEHGDATTIRLWRF